MRHRSPTPRGHLLLPASTTALAALALALAACGSQSTTKASAHLPAGHVSLTSGAAAAAGADSGPLLPRGRDWSTLLGSASHFESTPAIGPRSARVRWQRTLEGAIVAGPVTRGKVAYVSAGGVLHAIDIADGRDVWSHDGGGADTPGDLSTAPSVLADGTVLWPGPRHRVVALDRAGRVRWTLTVPGEPLTPAVDEALRLLVVADDSGHVSAYRLSDGAATAPALLWTRTLGASSFGSPALAADGTIYETADDSLFAVAAGGRTRWRLTTSQTIETGAAVAEDGTVVFGGNDQIEYGVAPDGSLRWRHAIGNFTYSSPAALPHDRVIFGNHSGEMTILDAHDGRPLTVDHGSGQLWTAAAVDARDDAYFASRTGAIYGFDARGRPLFEIATGATFASYPALAADGTLLVGGDDGVLRAIR